jgi:hypothetical protein
MATSMDIRLDYGTWPGDEGDTTEGLTSREGSPAQYQGGDFEQDTNLQRQQSSALTLSDLFSNVEEAVPDQDLLEAEMNGASSASTSQNTAHNTSHPPHPRRGTEGRNILTFTPISIQDSAVIDLTDSPPQPSRRSNSATSPRRTPSLPTSLDLSAMPPTLRSRVQTQEATGAASPPLHTEEHPRKRRRLSGRSSAAQPLRPEHDTANAPDIKSVDLTEINNESDLAKAISKQQQDAVQSQMKDSQDSDSGRTPLTSYKCPICMDTPEAATSTICGQSLPKNFQPPNQSPHPLIHLSLFSRSPLLPQMHPRHPPLLPTSPPRQQPQRRLHRKNQRHLSRLPQTAGSKGRTGRGPHSGADGD